jgi:hypothetical protein
MGRLPVSGNSVQRFYLAMVGWDRPYSKESESARALDF